MAKNLYVDTDNNRLLAGALTTQIASRPVFYGGNTETVTVDLIQRDSLQNLNNYAVPTSATVSLLVGVLGNVISVPSLAATSLSGITATATCSLYSTVTALATASLYSGITATATASLYGNITALATASVTRGTACTLSVTVVSVRTPAFQVGFVNRGTSATASLSYATTAGRFNPFGNSISSGPGDMFIEITDPGAGLYGNPQVYYADPWNNGTTIRSETINITNRCVFSAGKLVSIDPTFAPGVEAMDFVGPISIGLNPGFNVYSGDTTTVSASIVVVPDPAYVFSVESVSIACSGSGFPDGVNIPFSVPSDEDGDGRPCTGFLRAINGSVVSVVTISSRGGRFTSSTTSGKSQAIFPPYKISGITVTCAGAGYWEEPPVVVVDSLYFDSSAPGASPAQVSAVTVPGGQISLQLTNPGLGYVTAPNIRIAAPRISDGVRSVSLSNTPTGYAIGSYACTVSGPSSGVTASVNYVVTSGGSAFVVINEGSGYAAAPGVAVPSPNLTGSVQLISVTCAGAGYTTAPSVTISGNGSGASAVAVLSSGKLSSISVISYGFGYSGTITVTVAPPSNHGKIQSVTVLSGGTNYTTPPSVTFAGSGGASATAIISNGSVSSISLTDSGSGYATAPTITMGASPSRTVYSGVLTVTSAFVNSILPSTSVTVQINATTTVGTSTVLQAQGTVAATL